MHLLLIFMPPKEGSAPDLLPSAKEVVLGLLLLMMSPHESYEKSRRFFEVSYSVFVLISAFLSKTGSIATVRSRMRYLSHSDR